jgi:hypothetical protein
LDVATRRKVDERNGIAAVDVRAIAGDEIDLVG